MSPKPRKTATYDLVCGQGNEIVYRGRTSQDLEDRAAGHRSDGKSFDRIVPTSRRMTDEGAKRHESESLERYRRSHGGRNPRYNKTDHG